MRLAYASCVAAGGGYSMDIRQKPGPPIDDNEGDSMIRRRIALCACLLFAVVPMLASENLILVRIDAKAKRAYIPEGTILPGRLLLRAAKVRLAPVEHPAGDPDVLPNGPSLLRQSNAVRRLPMKRLAAEDTLVFEYAPSATFDGMRAHYAARAPKNKSRLQTDHDRSCSTIYMQDESEGLYGTYYAGFESTACSPAHGPFIPYNYYLYDFTATGYWADEGFVYVNDLNDNYDCQDSYPDSGTLTCTGSEVAQYWGSNTVETGGSFSYIEYQANYEPWYVGFYFESTWYTGYD